MNYDFTALIFDNARCECNNESENLDFPIMTSL